MANEGLTRAVKGGRIYKDDGTIVNEADLLEAIKNAVQMEFYGATMADRPLATAVPVGAYYTAVDTDEMWQSNGTEWVVKE